MKHFLFLLSFSFAAFGNTRWVTSDFAVTDSGQTSERAAVKGSCRENIQQVICLVNPAVHPMDPQEDRPCLAGGTPYARYFEALYDHYPPVLQKMFCSLKKLNIETKFFGTAYATILKKAGKINGAMIGIRKSVLDEGLDLQTWATWKEQLSFGGVKDAYVSTPGLPSIHTQSLAFANDFLYFVIAHEFGHLFDFANHLNDFKSKECLEKWLNDEKVECEMAPESWGALSWKTDKRPLPKEEFSNREGLCFYDCKKPIEKTLIPALYDGLWKSSFISTYAATEPWDDLADSLGYLMATRELETSYWIRTGKGEAYPIHSKLASPRFRSKLDYLQTFLNGTAILYP